MADKYPTFAALQRSEVAGKDYQVRCQDLAAPITIVAPHGGKIELATTEIAAAIARDDHNLYSFEGLKPDHNTHLHITSTRFDEPTCIELVSRSRVVVTVHGLAGNGENILVGGLHKELRNQIRETLSAIGFEASVEESGRYGGATSENICNKGAQKKGVQLEVQRGLRDRLRESEELMNKFASAVREAIARVAASSSSDQ